MRQLGLFAPVIDMVSGSGRQRNSMTRLSYRLCKPSDKAMLIFTYSVLGKLAER
jgi:hypothetical protein